MARLAQQPAINVVRDNSKARLRDFLHECIGSAPDEQADRIREAFSLLRQSAGKSKGARASLPDEFALETMLATGAYESAAIALLDRETGFMLSRGGNGTCLATIAAPGGAKESTAEACTLALALLSARISALLADPRERVDGKQPSIS